jgi:hypothetical protein
VPELTGAQLLRFGNVSVPSTIARTTGLEVSSPLLVIGLLLLAAAALRPLWSRSIPGQDRTLESLGAGVAMFVATSRLVWAHYLVLTLPAMLLAVRLCAAGAGRWTWVLCASLLPLTTGVMAMLATMDRTGVLPSAALNVSSLVLLAVALVVLWRGGVEAARAG